MLIYIFIKMLYMSLIGGTVIAFIALLGFLTKKHFSCKWNYYIWILGMMMLIFPFSYQTPDILKTDPAPTIASDQASPGNPVQQTAVEATSTQDKKAPAKDTAPVVTPSGVKAPETASFFSTNRTKILQTALPLIWIDMVLLLLIRKMVVSILFKRKLNSMALPANEIQLQVLEQATQGKNIKRKIRLSCFLGNSTPFITGILRPTIYIPQQMTDDTELKMILYHELTHCKRLDLLLKMLMDVITAIHFFNPMVHFMKARFDTYCELSCDEEVVNEMDPDHRKKYGIVLLNLMKREHFRLNGSAALCEKNKDFRKRMDIIMNKQKKCAAAISILLIAVMSISCVAFAAAVNSQNTVDPPKATYTGTMSNFDLEYGYSEHSVGPRIKDGAATFTDFMGYTVFRASGFGISKEILDKIDAIPKDNQATYEDWAKYYEDPNSYTDYFEINMDKVVRKYGNGYGLEGLFTLTKNGEIIFEKETGYLTNLPPYSVHYSLDSYTDLIIPFEKDGKPYDFSCLLSLEKIDSQLYTQQRFERVAFNRSRETKTVLLGEILDAVVKDEKADASPINKRLEDSQQKDSLNNSIGTAACNVAMSYGTFYAPLSEDCFLNFYFSENAPAAFTADSITGTFLVRTGITVTDAFEGTLSGLSKGPGEYVQLKSKDGSYQAKYKIVPQIDRPLNVKGTREVSEFYVEGEDVFIGTPAQQDDFDRDDHDRCYKRIITDEEGKVIAVVPIEFQQGDLSKHGDPCTFAQSWEGLFNRNIITTTRDGKEIETGPATLILQAPDSWWIKAVIPPEYQFFIKPEMKPAFVDIR